MGKIGSMLKMTVGFPFWFLSCFLLSFCPAIPHLLFSANAADATFRAQVESSQVEEGENVAVDFLVTTSRMSAAMGKPTYVAPDFDEVNVYQRGTSIESVYENGTFSVKRTDRVTAVLHPRKTGRLAIKNITIEVNGEVLKAPEIIVEVVASGSLSKNRLSQGGGNPFQPNQRAAPLPGAGVIPSPQRGAASLFIRTEPDKVKVYKGEQILLSYVIYSRAQVANLQVERYPTASGFLKEDIDIPLLQNKLDWNRSVVNGVEYNRAVLASYALFAVKEGKLPLDVFSAKITYRGGGTGLRNLFNDDEDSFGLNRFFQAFQMVTESKQSDRRTIEVLPIPADGQPPNFTGLVGEFDVTAMADKTTVKAGEPLNIKVKIEGKGHAGGLESLSMKWPSDFEQYEEKSSTHYNHIGTSERVFDFLVIPRVKGSFEIPPVEVAMFNPELKTYQIKKTDPLKIEVLEGAGGATVGSRPPGATLSQSATTQQSAVPQDIRNVLGSDAGGKSFAEQILLLFTKILAAGAGLGVVVMAFLLARGGAPTAQVRAAQAVKDLRAKIESLDQTVENDPVGTLSKVDGALADFLRLRFGVLKGSLTRSELTEVLKSHNVAENHWRRIESLGELCENQRFLPPEVAKNSQLARKAVEELRNLTDTLV